MRILLLEDTEDVAEAIAASFMRSGHAVDHVMSCQAAEDLLAVQEYDLLILDINLPDGAGGLEHQRGLGLGERQSPPSHDRRPGQLDRCVEFRARPRRDDRALMAQVTVGNFFPFGMGG